MVKNGNTSLFLINLVYYVYMYDLFINYALENLLRYLLVYIEYKNT